jgi:nucleotide-binding universal stress UspA family protein
MKTILTPLDFSDVSEAVVAQAAAMARALQGRIILLSVIQPPAITHEYAAIVDNMAEITAAGEKNAARRLGKIQSDLAEEGIPSEAVHLCGAPIPLIVEQAEAFAADYIVMGSHGHTALYDLLVGSTTHGVLMRAKCPVLIVPAAKEGKSWRDEEHHAYA